MREVFCGHLPDIVAVDDLQKYDFRLKEMKFKKKSLMSEIACRPHKLTIRWLTEISEAIP